MAGIAREYNAQRTAGEIKMWDYNNEIWVAKERASQYSSRARSGSYTIFVGPLKHCLDKVVKGNKVPAYRFSTPFSFQATCALSSVSPNKRTTS